MSEIREEAVHQLEKHQETLTLHDFVRIAESHHTDDGPGIDRDLLEKYAEAVYFDVDVSAVDDRLAHTDEWTGEDTFFEVGDGRVSAYPPDWHEALSGTDDILDVIEVVLEETDENVDYGEETVAKQGVSEEMVIRVAETTVDVDRGEIRDRIKQLRDEDEIEVFASQNRNPWIQLP